MSSRAVAALCCAVAVSGCSGMAQREDDRIENQRYVDYAGTPITHFSTLGRFDGWRSISKDQLLVWSGVDDVYLLKLVGPCDDLRYATRVAVTSARGEVNLGSDSVRVGRQTFRIAEIRPVDARKMREEQ